MGKTTTLTIVSLLVVNLCVSIYTAFDEHYFARNHAADGKLTEGQFHQIDKIFALAGEFRAEVEAVAGKASHPTEKKKAAATKYLQNHRMVYERARLEYKKAREERTHQSAARFLLITWGDDSILSGPGLMEVNEWMFGDYDQKSEGYVLYPNVSLTKLEALANEYRVLAISLMKEMQ
jgi:hypothetical protein